MDVHVRGKEHIMFDYYRDDLRALGVDTFEDFAACLGVTLTNIRNHAIFEKYAIN